MTDMYKMLELNYLTYGKSKIHVIIDNNDKLWFNVKDTLLALGYTDYRSTITNTIKPSIKNSHLLEKRNLNIDSFEGQPRSLYISESGLYRLMIKSTKKSASNFTDWIFDDVLPKIRKYGKYKLKKSYENQMYILSRKLNYMEK